MKKNIFLLVLLSVLLSTQVSAKWFQQKILYSKALQQEKTYYVGLPTGYNESDTITKYPVILFLHGASVTATDMVNSLEPFLDNFLTRLLFQNLFKVIFVIPDGSCPPYKGSFYTNSALYGNYEDYIVQDMMEEIAVNYHTYSSRSKWSILGHSMGGFGAMKIALKHPEKFIGVSSLSGPLNITRFDELLPIVLSENGTAAPYNFTYTGNVTKLMYSMAGAFSPDTLASPPVLFPINPDGNINQSVAALWDINNPINLIRSWQGTPAMAIHTYCGEKDEFKLAKQNQMFADTLDKYHLAHTYLQDPYGDHVTSLFTSLPQGINFLVHVMDTAQIRNLTTIEPPAQYVNPSSIYPNPAEDRFFVSGTSDDIRNLVIQNSFGQTLIMVSQQEIQYGVDIHSLSDGIYYVTIMDKSGNRSSLKLLKK
jgi:S-formylglutathione hydrolase FrmB